MPLGFPDICLHKLVSILRFVFLIDVYIYHLGTKELEDKLFAEIKGRIKEDDTTAPLRKGPYYYYERTLKGKEYVQHCRRPIPDNKATPSIRDTVPTEPGAPEEHVILDENIKAQNHDYYSICAFKVKPFTTFCFLFVYLFYFFLKRFFFPGQSKQ